jgi:hypothetical protein
VRAAPIQFHRRKIRARATTPALNLARWQRADFDIPRRQRCAERTAGITGGGLNPDFFKNLFAQNDSFRHAVERHAAGHAEILLAGDFAGVAREPHHDLFRDQLD